MPINVQQLHQELLDVNLPVISVRAIGTPIADFDLPLTPDQQIIADTVIANHVPRDFFAEMLEDSTLAVQATNLIRSISNWATWTADQATQYITSTILNGVDKATVENNIDSSVTNIATARAALKQLADNIIDIRTILNTLAQMVVLLRDINIGKYKNNL